MRRQLNRLRAIEVTRATRPGYYCDGAGLFLRVGPTGAKSWVFRYKIAGKTHEMGLGPTHTIGLAEARQKAQDARKLRLDGIDPIANRRAMRARAEAAAAKQITFRQAAEQYIAAPVILGSTSRVELGKLSGNARLPGNEQHWCCRRRPQRAETDLAY